MKVQMDLSIDENNWLKVKAKELKLKNKGLVVQQLIKKEMFPKVVE